MSTKRIIAREPLERLYITEALTLKEVAAHLHSSTNTIRRNMQEQGVPCRTNQEINTHHAMSTTRQYHIWQALKTRCTNSRQPNFQNYGARGIFYPPEWETFGGFWKDMGNGYSDDKTIDRTNNLLGYSKENCHWTTCQEQGRNKSNNALLTYQGKTQCITAWAEELHVPRNRLYSRKQMGWSDEHILTTPAQVQFIRGKRISTE